MKTKVSALKEKYYRIPVPARASLWFIFCSILQKGISIITVPIFTRLLTIEEYGLLTTYISMNSILIVFTSLTLYRGGFNNAMLKYESERQRFVSSMQGIVCVATTVVFACYLLLKNTVNEYVGLTTPMMLMLFAELLVTPSLQLWTSYNKFEFKYRPIVLVTVIKSLLNPLLGIILVLVSKDRALARIVSIVLVEVCVCGTVALVQFYKGRCFYSKEYWSFALKFNLPLIPHFLSWQILNQSDRIMISYMVNKAAVAKYGVAYNLCLMLNIITQAIDSTFTPWFYQKFRKNEREDLKRISSVLMVIMAVAIVFLEFVGPEILLIFAPVEYYDAIYVIPPVVASVFFVFLYNFYVSIQYFFKRTKFIVIGSLISAGLNIILNLIFIKKYGYVAAAYTTMFCQLCYFLLHYKSSMRVCAEMGVKDEVFNTKLVFILLFSIIAISIIINLMYKSTVVRYAFLFIGLAVVFVKRKKLFLICKKTYFEMHSEKNSVKS